MAGKPRQNRSTIAAHHLGLRLTDAEHAALNRIVEEEAQKLRSQGLRIVMTQTAVVRMLIEQEAKRRGFPLEPETKQVPPAATQGHVMEPARSEVHGKVTKPTVEELAEARAMHERNMDETFEPATKTAPETTKKKDQWNRFGRINANSVVDEAEPKLKPSGKATTKKGRRR